MPDTLERDPLETPEVDPAVGNLGYEPDSQAQRQQEIDDNPQYDQEYIDDDQGPSGRQVADKAVGSFLAKNAPKGSAMRGWQAKLRLLRQKGFNFLKDPGSLVRETTPEEQLRQDRGIRSRYENQRQEILKKSGTEFGSAAEQQAAINQHLDGLSKTDRDKFTRLQNRYDSATERDLGRAAKGEKITSSVAPPQATPAAESALETGAGATAEGAATAGAAAEGAGVAESAAASASAAGKAGWMSKMGAKVAEGQAKVAAAKQAALASARQQAAKMAAKKGATAVAGRVLSAVLAEQVIPVIGQILGIIQLALLAIWALFKTKLGRWILIGLMVLIALPGIVFALAFGSTLSVMLPSTPAQENEAKIAAAIGGDFAISGRTLSLDTFEAEQERYQVVLTNLKRTNPERVPEVESEVKTILTLLKGTSGLSKEAKKKQTAEVIKKMEQLDSTLPFGQWIAELAKAQVGKPSQEFCRITKAASRVACASFVSTVLQNAGVPNPIEAGVDGIWRRPFYRVIADRPAQKNADYYAQNKSKLQPGDLIFWGDGACSKGGSVMFDHIGFYIGEDQAVDNSSSKEAIAKRQAAKRDNCRVFNGAKRYGANL